MKFIIDELLKVASEIAKKGEVPVAAAIIDKDCNLISIMGNNRQSEYNVLGHAEILCIQEAEKKIKDWRLDGYSMIVTLEPCTMCDVIIMESRLDKVFYLLDKKEYFPGNKNKNFNNYEQLVEFENEKEIYNELLSDFFNKMR